MTGKAANGRAGNAADHARRDPILDGLVSGGLGVVVALGNPTTVLGIPWVVDPGSVHDHQARLNLVHAAGASEEGEGQDRQGNNRNGSYAAIHDGIPQNKRGSTPKLTSRRQRLTEEGLPTSLIEP
mgnify:CR=1 FL=1